MAAVVAFKLAYCGGVSFFLMDAMLGAKRTTPLTILGPKKVEAHLRHVQEALFPGGHVMKPRFDLQYCEILPDETTQVLNHMVAT